MHSLLWQRPVGRWEGAMFKNRGRGEFGIGWGKKWIHLDFNLTSQTLPWNKKKIKKWYFLAKQNKGGQMLASSKNIKPGQKEPKVVFFTHKKHKYFFPWIWYESVFVLYIWI